MDMIYMTDVMAYQTIRGPIYDKYNSWDQQDKGVQAKHQNNQKKNKEKEPCQICRERERRSLMKYIRSKSHNHGHEIKEEEEEDMQTETKNKEETKC